MLNPQTFVRAILYTGAGAVLFSLVFCAAALVPALQLDQVQAAKIGAGVGAVVGFVFGLTRRFA